MGRSARGALRPSTFHTSASATPAGAHLALPVTPTPPTALAVSPIEAARLLGISRTTIYTLLDSGAIPSALLNRRRLIPVSALQAWLDRQVSLTSASGAGARETSA